MATKRKKKLSPAQAAAALARQGKWEEALTQLTALSEQGDGHAAASTTELLAALGRWKELVPHAARFLENPRVVYAGNVFTDVTRLVRRAARELSEPSIIQTLAAKIPQEWSSMRDATLLKDAPDEGPERRDAFDRAVKAALTEKRFKNKPAHVLAQHCFALAQSDNIDDEMISRYDPAWRRFDTAEATARAYVRKGDPARAWVVLEQAASAWYPVDHAQVFPVVLLVDRRLGALMTKERCLAVLATPRGEFAS